MRLIDRILTLFGRGRISIPPPGVQPCSPAEPSYEVLYGQQDGKLRRFWRKATTFPHRVSPPKPVGPPVRIPSHHPTVRVQIRPREDNTPQLVDVSNDVTRKGPR